MQKVEREVIARLISLACSMLMLFLFMLMVSPDDLAAPGLTLFMVWDVSRRAIYWGITLRSLNTRQPA